MTSDSSNEKRLKQCLQLIIPVVSDAIKNSNDDLKAKIKKILDDNLSTLSRQCRNYLLDVLHQFGYHDANKTLKKDSLPTFLHDLQGRLSLLDASQAAWDGDRSIVKSFIDNYRTLKDKSGLYGTTLLYSAARNDHMDLVRYLIETAGCSVNVRNEEYLGDNQQAALKATTGSTALHAACFNGRLEIVKYLIEHGGDYFILNSALESPMENGQSRGNIRTFFVDFLVPDYSRNSNIHPSTTILREIGDNQEKIVDCIWEYKPLLSDQWFAIAAELSTQLQQALVDEQIQTDIRSKTSRDIHELSLIKFLRSGMYKDQVQHLAWLRCRGSSLRNFHCYSQWQMMFSQHPTGVVNSSPSIQIDHMISSNHIELSSWYNSNPKMNLFFETAMNYRRKYVTMHLDFLNNEEVTFDLEHFTFVNKQNTIQGFLRWIPKITSNDTSLIVLDNFQLPTNSDAVLLTTERVRKAESKGHHSADVIGQYGLKYEDVFANDNLNFYKNKSSIDANDSTQLLNVVQDDLITVKTDVIVLCTSSQYLLGSVFKAAGKSLRKVFEHELEKNANKPVISIPTDGKLASKAVYFVSWEPNSDPHLLCQSIETLVSNVFNKAADENYKSIAFPAIGCGNYGCSISLVAQAFVAEVQRQLVNHPMETLFVIQPNKMDIYDEFQKQVASFKQPEQTSITIGEALIQVEKGNITHQTVDVIIGSSSSENLRQVLLKAGGSEVEKAYKKEYKKNPNALLISTPPGELPCQRIFFLKWEPDQDPNKLRQSIVDLIWNLIQNVSSHNFTSLAFPAIGCGEHACSVDIVVKTTVREMIQQIMQRKLPWIVKFIVQPSQQNIYDEFSRQLLSSDESSQEPMEYQLPSTWQKTKEDKFRLIVPKNTDEYKSILTQFNADVKGNCQEIIRIERIQNERWFMQYLAHVRDFRKRLGEETEKRLYHGCSEIAANSIIEDCFNRSFAGVNGTAYGVGVYFSSDAQYSHGYTRPNSNGERCMFVARVLVGKTTLGNSSMKTRPVGFDSTTDGKHMCVTYHDAQAYAEYLITYK